MPDNMKKFIIPLVTLIIGFAIGYLIFARHPGPPKPNPELDADTLRVRNFDAIPDSAEAAAFANQPPVDPQDTAASRITLYIKGKNRSLALFKAAMVFKANLHGFREI